jgi:hypothetical protein
MDRATPTAGHGRWPYARVQATACALALRRRLGRWLLAALVALLLASAGAGPATAGSTALALAAWTALPLARGAAAGPAACMLAVLGSAAAGLGLVVAARHLLWPTAWREAEHALPIARRDTVLSDLPWVTLAALPWAVLQGAGIAVWLAQRPPWLAGHEAAMVVAGVGATLAAVVAGLALQQFRRRGVRHVPTQHRRGVPLGAGLQRPAGPARVLFWWPLWRGVAPRVAFHALMAPACGAVLLGALAWRPSWAPWWLAVQGVVAMVLVVRLRALATLELAPLLQACAVLPLSPARLRAALDGVCMLPGLAAAAALAAAVPAAAPHARPGVLAAWWCWLLAAALLELRAPARDTTVQSARWIFLSIVVLALASEVMPA